MEFSRLHPQKPVRDGQVFMQEGAMDEAVRWNIKVSRDTDLALRRFLGSQGTKKGDLSKFIEEAVRAQVFQCTVQDIKSRNADPAPDALQSLIDDALMSVTDI